MALEIRKSSKWWYGSWMINGRKAVINLGVPITGKRPPKRTMLGDDEFERSRGRAQEAHDRQEKQLTLDRNAESALGKLVEIKTGKPAGFPKLAELPRLWLEIPRRKTPGKHYVAQCTAILERFVAFVQTAKPGIKEFVEVTPEIAKAFMDAEQVRGVSPSTWNYSLELLRTTFKRLHPQLPHGHNPFREFVTKAADTVSRVPFTPEELKAIQEACADDDFIRPVIITGMCTAMRRGDCCCLKWSDVDLKEGFISVKTSKTGEKVDIPIFPLLQEELERTKAAGKASAYCFPEAAEMYLRNADGISIRVKAVLARAFERLETAGRKELPSPASPDEIRKKSLAHVAGLTPTSKAERMRTVLELYLAGKSIDAIVTETGFGQGTVSAYLNEIQNGAAVQLIRTPTKKQRLERLQAARTNGLRRASIRDFHSFRVTWITLALAAGVPLELVQRVTGHRTVEVVMKHYFRPGRQDFRQAILKAMPKMLADHPSLVSPREQMLAILDQMSAKTWKADSRRLRELVARVS
ncbi:MAG: tyrosine-type recombinase/integrase [Verrucomicrobia bacterium]|nr:tyrosine-type recombinase/integrase [Verrucomicrobiota bacterium]